MWLYSGENDPMRLSCKNHEKEVVDEVMKILYSTTTVPNPSDKILPLYRLSTSDEIVAAMPRFDRWGLLADGPEGERENPLQAIPDTGIDGETEASTDAGGS